MKKMQVVYLFSLLMICFLWSCNPETISSTNIEDIAPKEKAKGGKPGKPGGGGGGGDSETLYQVSYSGPLTNSVIYGPKTTSNAKYDLIDTYNCGAVAIYGLDNLLGTSCFGIPCDAGNSVRQPNKKDPSLIRRAITRFGFRDPNICNGNVIWLRLYGDIQNPVNGKYTLFPVSTNEPVVINIDSWEITCSKGAHGCLVDRVDWTASQQQVIISLAPNGQCSGGSSCP